MTTADATQTTVSDQLLAPRDTRRRCGRRTSLVSVAALAAALTTSPWTADAAPKLKRIKVAFSVVPVVGKIGAPTCASAGCLLVAEPNAAEQGGFTGDWEASNVGTQAISLRPGGALPPTAVSVLVVADGTVKGCGAGTIVFHGLFNDYSNLSSGKGGRGTWTLLTKTGTGGMVGATGSGTMVEILNADFSTKMIDHTGTITCRPA